MPPVAFDDGSSRPTGSESAGAFPWERGRDGTDEGTAIVNGGRDGNDADQDRALDTMISEYFHK